MAKKRPAACYRKPKRSYTRTSKYRELSYVKGVPGSKIRKFNMGDPHGDYDYLIDIKANRGIQIRHNALEAFRTSINHNLEKRVGRLNYYFRLKIYPHQIMRHNPTANFAGADRFSSGMKHAFGKPLGRAAIVKQGQSLSIIKAREKDLKAVKKSCKIGVQRLPCKCSINIRKTL